MDMTSLRDPIWQFLGFVATIGSVVITTILTYFVFREGKRKELTYTHLYSTALVWRPKLQSGLLQLLWNGKEITNLHLVVVKIANTGAKEIVISDFNEPISITFPGSGEVVSAELGETEPPNLRPEIAFTQCATFRRVIH